MENLNIDQYLNKVDGNTLPASEWNACLTAVQTKVNELVGAVSNNIQMSDTYAEDTTRSIQLGTYGITFGDRENPKDYFAPADYSQFDATGFDVHSGLGEPNPRITGIRFRTDCGLELVKINTGDEYDGACWGESHYGDDSTIRLDIDGSGVAANEKIRWNTSGDVIVNSIDAKLIKTTNSNNQPVNGISGQFVIGGSTYTFTNGILTNVEYNDPL